MNELFRRFAQRTSEITGSAWTFLLAAGVIVAWILVGPIAHFSNTWLLAINTGTTLVTFLMVFLIQNTQNRNARAQQLKLDELIRSHSDARNGMMDLETLSDEELDRLQEQFQRIRQREQARNNPVGAIEAAEMEELVAEEKRSG